MGPIYSIADAIDLLRRRARLIAIVTFIGSIVSVFIALSEAHVYESVEVIQIQRPEIATTLAPSTVDGSAARRLQLIQQRLTTRGTILEVIDKFNMFEDRDDMTETQKVVRLRNAIEIDDIAAAQGGIEDGTVSVVTVIARDSDPYLAQALASEFARRTVELAAMERLQQARATLDFFAEQEDRMVSSINALEEEITDFRLRNDVAIDGTLEFRRSEISTINAALLEIERERIGLMQEAQQIDPNARESTRLRLMAEFNSELASLDEQSKLLNERRNQLQDSIKTSPEMDRQLGIYDRQLEQLNQQLDVISNRRVEAEVSLRLETQRQAERLTVIEPAAFPELPITPPRRNKAIVGALASFVLGVGIAFLLDLMHPVLRSARQMEREIGIAPVVCIPMVGDDEPRRPKNGLFARLRRRWLDRLDGRLERG